jgi:hypothetical protein
VVPTPEHDRWKSVADEDSVMDGLDVRAAPAEEDGGIGIGLRVSPDGPEPAGEAAALLLPIPI